MTTEELEALFETHNGEFLNFDRVTDKRSSRRDVHAFLLLNELVPGDGDIVGSARHDEIHLAVEPEELAEVATEAQVIELIRCGLRVDEYGLCMFV